MKLEFFRQIFEKYSNTKFHKNPSGESRVVACGRTDVETDMSNLVVAFRNFANAPKICVFFPQYVYLCVWYASQNKVTTSLYTINRFICNGHTVFSVRYEQDKFQISTG